MIGPDGRRVVRSGCDENTISPAVKEKWSSMIFEDDGEKRSY